MKQLRYAWIKLPSMAGHADISIEINLPNLKALYMHAGSNIEHLTVNLGKCPELRVLIASHVHINWQVAFT
jgi:hypothetical protein